MQYTATFHRGKNLNFQMKKCDIFLIFTQNIDQRKYSEKSENILGLDSYILNSLNYLNVIWTYISHRMTSLLKLEITV